MVTQFAVLKLNDIPTSIRYQMFKLRKDVFCDRLCWNLPQTAGLEIDCFDDHNAEYFLWIEPTEEILLGAIRLCALNHQTLLQTVFYRTYSQCDISDFSQPNAYIEGTRLCFHQKNIQSYFDDPRKAFAYFLSGLFEVYIHKQAEYLIANFDPCIERRCHSLGLSHEILGEDHSFGVRPVKCGKFPLSNANFNTIHNHLNTQQTA